MTTKSIVLPISPVAPYGLNKQKESSILGPEWATTLTNFYYGADGVLTSREGTQNQHSNQLTSLGVNATSLFEYVDASGTNLIIAAGVSSPYSVIKISSGTATNISGTITTPTGGYWKFVNFNGKCVGFQSGHAPIVLATVGGSFADVSLSGTTQPTTAVDTVLSAFGRLWVIDGQNLKYCDLLDETAWNSSYSLKEYWGEGGDIGIALAEFNGHLIIFGKNHIIIYRLPEDGDVDSLILVETISGVGIRGRDAYTQVGDDLWFLTISGLVSLGRVIQEKSMPIVNISNNIKDYMNSFFSVGGSVDSPRYGIKAQVVYIPNLSMCLVTSSFAPFVFDTKKPLPDGSYRVTTWNLLGNLMVSLSGNLYCGGNYVTKYGGYGGDGRDYTTNAATQEIALQYISPWFDLDFIDASLKSKNKILKTISTTLYNDDSFSAGEIVIGWSTDFNDFAIGENISSSDPSKTTRTVFTELANDGVNKYKTAASRNGQFFCIALYAQDLLDPNSDGVFNQMKVYSFNIQLKIGKDVV